MASASLSSAAFMISRPPITHTQPQPSSLSFLSPSNSNSPINISQLRKRGNNPRGTSTTVKAEFDIGLFERDLEGSDGSQNPTIPRAGLPEFDEEAEQPCPPGLRKYETMVVLRPDMSEDERLAFTQKYEELLVAGGGMYVEVFNRGVIPLAYSIRKKNKAGESNTYLDGIYLLFTYFTKPESMSILTETLLADDNVLRSSSFKIRKRKMF